MDKTLCVKCKSEKEISKKCIQCGCGSNEFVRNIAEPQINVNDTLKIKQKRRGYKKPILEYKETHKISGKSKRQTHEILSIDKINKIKQHRVDELINGEWNNMHNENISWSK